METGDLSESLRLVLLLIGAAFIAVIYIASVAEGAGNAGDSHLSALRRRLLSLRGKLAFAAKRDKRAGQKRVRPQINAEGEGEQEADPSAPPRYLVILYVQAMAGYTFSGHAIVHAARRAGLRKTGDARKGFFQYQPDGQSAVVHVTDKMNPGLFIWQDMDKFSTTGLSVFAELQALDAHSTLQSMLDCANKLADALGGSLLDENHQALTTSKIKSIKKAARLFFARPDASGQI